MEGDMFFPRNSPMTRGAAMLGSMRRWPDGIIPYDLSGIQSRSILPMS